MSITAYSAKSRFELKYPKIGISFIISPLNYNQRVEILALSQSVLGGQNIEDFSKAIFRYVKFMVKDVKGINDEKGNPFVCQLDENNNLKDECVDDLLNLQINPGITDMLAQFVNGIPTELVDLEGKVIKEVKLISPGGQPKK
jgi:hypothetical protein